MTRADIFARRLGSGPIEWLALHGWAGSHAIWNPVFQTVGTGVLAVDLPGYGRSAAPDRWTMDAVTDRLLSAMDAAGLERVSIVGACSGAIYAAWLFRRAPERVERLVMIEPFADTPWYFRPFLWPGFGRLALWTAFYSRLGGWLINRSVESGGERPSLRGFGEVDPATVLGVLSSLDGVGGCERLASGIGAPGAIDLVWGSDTLSAVRVGVARWKRAWPASRTIVVPEAGHLLVQDNPAAVAAILTDRPAA